MWTFLTFLIIGAYIGIAFWISGFKKDKKQRRIKGAAGEIGDGSGVPGDFGSPASMGDTDGSE